MKPAAQVARKVDRMQRQLDGRAMAEQVKELGNEARRDALAAARQTRVKSPGRTLTDLSMSGWHRGNPVVLATRQTLRDDQGRRVVSTLVTPDRTAGLWRVLQDGRAAARKFQAGDGAFSEDGRSREGFRRAGSRKDGSTKWRRLTRNVGAMEGKGTWDAAVRSMLDGSQRRGKAKFQRAMRRVLDA